MNFTENSSRSLLIYRGMKEIAINENVNLILTPQFYTMRKEILPVKYAYQAKRIAHSFFEGLLEGGKSYRYFVYKEDEQWVFIAYDPEEILSFIRSINLPAEHIHKIFFAQQIASQIVRPIALDEQIALAVINDIATMIPLSALSDQVPFDPQKIMLPKKSIHLDTGAASFLSRKQIWTLAGGCVLLGIVWIIEGARYGKDNHVLQEKLSELYAENPSLMNSYTRESIAGKYRKIDNVERKKRHMIGKIAGLIFKGVTLRLFDMDQKKFIAVFETDNVSTTNRLKSLLKEAGFALSISSSGNKIVIEGAL